MLLELIAVALVIYGFVWRSGTTVFFMTCLIVWALSSYATRQPPFHR